MALWELDLHVPALCTLLQTKPRSRFGDPGAACTRSAIPAFAGFSLRSPCSRGSVAAGELVRRARPQGENRQRPESACRSHHRERPSAYSRPGTRAPRAWRNPRWEPEDLDLRGALGFELFTDYWPTGIGPSAGGVVNPPARPKGREAGRSHRRSDARAPGRHSGGSAAAQTLRFHALPGWQATLEGRPPSFALDRTCPPTVEVPPGQAHPASGSATQGVRTLATGVSGSLHRPDGDRSHLNGEQAVWAVAGATVTARSRALLLMARLAGPAGEMQRLSIYFGGFATLAGAPY